MSSNLAEQSNRARMFEFYWKHDSHPHIILYVCEENPSVLFLKVMHHTRFLFLAFLSTSALATPVGDDSNFQSGATLSSDPLNLDLDPFQDPTNQPPPDAASSKSASGSLATEHDPQNMPFQENSKQPVDLPQKLTGDFSNNAPASLLSTNSPLFPPSSQEPATANSPERADVPSQPSSTPGGVSTALVVPPIPPLLPKNGPDCKGWWRLCCFGEIFFDDEGLLSVDQCYPCNDSFRFWF